MYLKYDDDDDDGGNYDDDEKNEHFWLELIKPTFP